MSPRVDEQASTRRGPGRRGTSAPQSDAAASIRRRSARRAGIERGPPLSTPIMGRTGGLAATPGSCRMMAGCGAGTDGGESRHGEDRACGGDRRRRSDGADAGGRAGAGGRRRRHRRAARQPGPRRLARGRPARTHHRGPRSARDRRSVPLARDRWRRSRGSPASRLDISDFPTRHPYGLGLWQNHIERILAGWVGELAVPIHRGREVTGFAQDDTGVDVELSDGQSLRAEYLVGCDGGRSLIRKAAGIEFPGWDPTTSSLIAEVEMAEEPELGIRRGRPRHPCHRPGGVRDPRRRGRLRGRGPVGSW